MLLNIVTHFILGRVEKDHTLHGAHQLQAPDGRSLVCTQS